MVAVGWELGAQYRRLHGMREVLRSRFAGCDNEARRKISLSAGASAAYLPAIWRSPSGCGAQRHHAWFALRRRHPRNQREPVSTNRVTGERHADAHQHLRLLARAISVCRRRPSIRAPTASFTGCTSLARKTNTENIEILLASHTGLGFNAAALWRRRPAGAADLCALWGGGIALAYPAAAGRTIPALPA